MPTSAFRSRRGALFIACLLLAVTGLAGNPVTSASAVSTVNPLAGPDFNGDGRTDLVVSGVPGWSSVPVAFSNGNGTFTITNNAYVDFAGYAATPGARLVTGDFNGDGKSDVALTGASGWTSIPVLFSLGDGSFDFTSYPYPDFAGYAATLGAELVTGDFNGDRKTDLALTGAAGWTSIPILFSRGDGGFTFTSYPYPDFAGYAATPGARLVTGDFNGDGKTDLALTGADGWTSIPVLFSRGDGGFDFTSYPYPEFAGYAATPGARLVTGDFNGDRKTDLALTGAAGWTSIPILFSRGDGGFDFTSYPYPEFAGWAATDGVALIARDFNGDGRTDLVVTGAPGWSSVPVAFSNGDGGFTITNAWAGYLPGWTATAGAQVVPGDFNGDGRTDLVVTGVPGWSTVPVAFSNGNGTFDITNAGAGYLPGWTATPGSVVGEDLPAMPSCSPSDHGIDEGPLYPRTLINNIIATVVPHIEWCFNRTASRISIRKFASTTVTPATTSFIEYTYVGGEKDPYVNGAGLGRYVQSIKFTYGYGIDVGGKKVGAVTSCTMTINRFYGYNRKTNRPEVDRSDDDLGDCIPLIIMDSVSAVMADIPPAGSQPPYPAAEPVQITLTDANGDGQPDEDGFGFVKTVTFDDGSSINFVDPDIIDSPLGSGGGAGDLDWEEYMVLAEEAA